MKAFKALLIVLLALSLAPVVMAQEKKDEKKTTRHYVYVKDGQVYSSDDGPIPPIPPMPPNVFFVSRGFLGVQTLELTPELREHYRVPKDAGVLVSKVVADSPAAKAGIRVGDIITAVDGKAIDSSLDVAHAVREKKNNETVKIDYVRDGAKAAAIATVTRRERKEVDVREFNVEIPDVGRHMSEYFNSPEWKAKMEHLQSMPDCSKLDAKMKELDAKLKELEKRLQQK